MSTTLTRSYDLTCTNVDPFVLGVVIFVRRVDANVSDSQHQRVPRFQHCHALRMRRLRDVNAVDFQQLIAAH